jgi:adenosylcobinamide kinase/adenosylcobinamide-phosphate guanylyltransferase
MNTALPPLTLVIGGAASGKSGYAETLVVADGRARIYLATAQAHDAEMTAKILKHRYARGAGWRTIEAPLDLSAPLAEAASGDVVLLDCATLWLTNHLLAGSCLETAQKSLLAALAGCAAPVVVVSNEVGGGIVPDNPLSRRFRDAQGHLNRALAAQADTVVTVIAGLPLVLKGGPA